MFLGDGRLDGGMGGCVKRDGWDGWMGIGEVWGGRGGRDGMGWGIGEAAGGMRVVSTQEHR